MISSFLELRVRLRDKLGLGYPDAGAGGSVAQCLTWLRAAQDNSLSADGGVARHFSIKTGWSPSYPETTGYIVATLLDGRHDPDAADSKNRAIRLLDWFTRI